MVSSIINYYGIEFFKGRTILILSSCDGSRSVELSGIDCIMDVLENSLEEIKRPYYDIIICIGSTGISYPNDLKDRCKWLFIDSIHPELENSYDLSTKRIGESGFLYEYKKNIEIEGIQTLTGKFRTISSDKFNNQEYIDRVDELEYRSSVPADRYWTFELIEATKDIIDFSTIKTILDIGSRDCYQSVEFSTWFPDAKIYAFEANPQSIPLCHKVSDGNPNITVIPKAASTYDGETSFYQVPPGGNIGASSMLNVSDHPRSSEWRGNLITIPCTRIDSFMESIPDQTADILWIDVQGAELYVLQGATETLKDVKVIATEIGIDDMYEGGTLKSDLDCFLKHHGFVCLSTYAHGTNLELGHLKRECGEIDAIYIKEEYLK